MYANNQAKEDSPEEEKTKQERDMELLSERHAIRSPSTYGSNGIIPTIAQALSKYKYRLKSIFEHYCSYGESGNITKLKCAKFTKLLRDADLVKPLSGEKSGKYPILSSTADLIFSQYSTIMKMRSPERTNMPGLSRPRTGTLYSTGSMNFEQFLNSLVTISGKIYNMKLELAIQSLIEEYILKLEAYLGSERVEKNRNIVQILDISKDNELSTFIDILKKSFGPFYKYYCNHKGLMDILAFTKFCSDFDIFPDLCSKPFLVRLFATLYNLQSSSMESNDKQSDKTMLIDETKFIQGIVLCALEMSFIPSNLSKEERVDA